MEALKTHFTEQFRDPKKEVHIEEKWWERLPKIPNELKEGLEKDITVNEITLALFKDMRLRKSPGNDELTCAFYRAFWNEI